MKSVQARAVAATAGAAPRCALVQRRVARRPFVARRSASHVQQRQLRAVVRAEEVTMSSADGQAAETSFVPVLRPEDLPKGVRKEVRIQGKSVLMFWYRNQIYAIEARSPAEGAYSEGFIKAKFTQDYCIECPATGSMFSLKDGSIVSWYPGNVVLRALTPSSTCRPMEIYPVQLQQDAIMVDVSGSSMRAGLATTRGGSDTSLENNNVYGLEPRVYVEGGATDPAGVEEGSGDVVAKAATISVTVLAVSAVATAGTAAVVYFFFR